MPGLQADAGEERAEPDLAFERVVFFSDAVFAIAITLLVLEIRVPHLARGAANRELAMALVDLIPKISGFIVSFFVVGSMWIEHHRIFRYMARCNEGLLWRNLLLLLLVAFMPFPTALFSENYTVPAALAIYAFSFGLLGLLKLWVWTYAARRQELLAPSATPAIVMRFSRRSWAVPLTCFATGVAGGAGVPGAYAGFMLIPVVARLLDRPKPEGHQPRRRHLT